MGGGEILWKMLYFFHILQRHTTRNTHILQGK